MTEKLGTTDLNKKYMDSMGVRCPHCESYNLLTSSTKSDDNYCSRDIECEDCGEEWVDVYTLTSAEFPSKNEVKK